MLEKFRNDESFSQSTFQSLEPKLKPYYMPKMLEALNLVNLNEEFMHKHFRQFHVNQETDRRQLSLIIKLIDTLCLFHFNIMDGLLPNVHLSENELFLYEGIALRHSRQLLTAICVMFSRITGDLRGKYKKQLLPLDMRWEKIERLGWILNPKPADRFYTSMIVGDVTDDEKNAYIRLFKEGLHREEVLEPAANSIIHDDLPQLALLAKIMMQDSAGELAEDYVIPTFELRAIHTFIKRMGDSDTLLELSTLTLNLTPQSFFQISEKLRKNTPKKSNVVNQIVGIDKEYKVIKLDSELEVHSSLRLLQRIGELTTGKNLSLRLEHMHTATDWQSLIVVRDGLCHPEERRNAQIIEMLLQDRNMLSIIIEKEIPDLHQRIYKIIELRDKELPKTIEDRQQFWNNIYEFEKSQLERKKVQIPIACVQTTIITRAPENDIHFFLNALQSNNCPPKEFVLWRDILNGIGQLPRGKEAVGVLMRYLPPKGMPESPQRQIFNACKKIATLAISPRSDKEDRMDQRTRQQDEAAERLTKKEAQFTGLEQIRRLAQLFEASGPLLPRTSLLDFAITATLNILSFTERQIGYVPSSEKAYLTFYLAIKKSFKDNYIFARAIECNVGQLLQCLERIKTYPESQVFQTIKFDFEVLREFRNYIEHGNYRTETEIHTSKDTEIKSPRAEIVPTLSLAYALELLPKLKQLRATIAKIEDNYNFFHCTIPMIEEHDYPIFKAIINNEIENVRRLAKHPKQLSLIDPDNGMMPLHLAIVKNYVEIAIILIEAGADVTRMLPNGMNPLHIAAHQGFALLLKKLLQINPQVNSLSLNGNTPLHEASKLGHKECVLILLEAGADPTIKEPQFGLTAANLAHDNAHEEIEVILLNKASFEQRFIQDCLYFLFVQRRHHRKDSAITMFVENLILSIKKLSSGDTVFKMISAAFYLPLYESNKNVLVEIKKILISKMKDYNSHKEAQNILNLQQAKTQELMPSILLWPPRGL